MNNTMERTEKIIPPIFMATTRQKILLQMHKINKSNEINTNNNIIFKSINTIANGFLSAIK